MRLGRRKLICSAAPTLRKLPPPRWAPRIVAVLSAALRIAAAPVIGPHSMASEALDVIRTHVGHKHYTWDTSNSRLKKMLCSYFLLRARTGALNPETSLWHASPRSQPWQRWRSSRWRRSLTRASCCKVGAAAAQSRCVSIAFHSSMCFALGRHLSPQNTIVFNWSTASFRYRQGGAALGGLRTDGPN